MEIGEITSWNNPVMRYCVIRLRKVPDYDFENTIRFPDEQGGQSDYVSRLLRVLFGRPDGSGDVERLDEAIKYIKNLSKDEFVEFVVYMRIYANASRQKQNKML